MRLRVWVAGKEVPEGPFPLTETELKAARREWARKWRQGNLFGRVAQSPSTIGREILSRLAPRLSAFDRMVLAYAVTARRVRWEVVVEGGAR